MSTKERIKLNAAQKDVLDVLSVGPATTSNITSRSLATVSGVCTKGLVDKGLAKILKNGSVQITAAGKKALASA